MFLFLEFQGHLAPMILEMFIFLDVKKPTIFTMIECVFLRNPPYGVLVVPNSVVLILFARYVQPDGLPEWGPLRGQPHPEVCLSVRIPGLPLPVWWVTRSTPQNSLSCISVVTQAPPTSKLGLRTAIKLFLV